MILHKPVIFDALRTPRGKGKAAQEGKSAGALAEIAPYQLVAGLIDGLEQRNPGFGQSTESLTLGCVGQVGSQGGHIALVSRLASPLPDTTVVTSLNNYCVSGLTAVAAASKAVEAGATGLHLAGGVESMSQVGFLADQAPYYTDAKTRRRLKWAPPIMGAELIATLDGFSKVDLDELTLMSHQRADQAWQSGAYTNSVQAVKGESGQVVLQQDEWIQGDLNREALRAMPPAFVEQGAQGFDAMMLKEYPDLEQINHLHSLLNCPAMADAASLILIGNQVAGEQAGLTPLARITAIAEVTSDPVLQLTGGLRAVDQLLADTGRQINDFDRIEFMEAFAAVPLKFLRDYGADPDKVNVNGGHLAMGHPLGATGAILLTTLAHELQHCDGETGLVVAQAGGGIGAAIIAERC